MIISLHPNFDKSYRKRIYQNKKLTTKVDERVEIFRQNPKSSLLKVHGLIGNKKGYQSFSITGDIRIVFYYKSEDEIVFYDIGSHNQVY